jgi:putative ABC transport system substrate-binding protein
MNLLRPFAAAVLSLAIGSHAGAQQYKIGMISGNEAPADASPIGSALIHGLTQHGDELGKNLSFERRGAQGHMERLPGLVEEPLASKVDAIFATGYPAALAAAKATSTVPIVVFQAGDPVSTGMVQSFAHPGGNITGLSEIAAELSGKRLQVLKEAVPGIKRVAMLWNADDLGMSLREKAAESGAQQLGITVQSLGVRAPDDFDQAFAGMTQQPPDGILMVSDALTTLNRKRIFEYAAAHRIPAIYEYDNLVRDGGLMSYGPDQEEMAERAAALLDRILKGAKPADLPLEQPTRFRFAINLKTAQAIGFTFPQSIVVRADEVIE